MLRFFALWTPHFAMRCDEKMFTKSIFMMRTLVHSDPNYDNWPILFIVFKRLIPCAIEEACLFLVVPSTFLPIFLLLGSFPRLCPQSFLQFRSHISILNKARRSWDNIYCVNNCLLYTWTRHDWFRIWSMSIVAVVKLVCCHFWHFYEFGNKWRE